MPRKRQAGDRSGASELDAFDRQVEAALEHCRDAPWLGAHSPLAAPYFIGGALVQGTGDNNLARGLAFARLLQDCASSLEAEQQDLLRTMYFVRDPYKDNVALAMAMHVSERTFYRTRIAAIKALARALNRTVAPPLRLEMPEARRIVGRAREFARAVDGLRLRRTVLLHGPGGIGKSALGAALAQQWSSEAPARGPAFWYTLRGRFNDHVVSFAFALGHFLNLHGAGNAWRQLVADRGVVDLERIAGLLRYDLAALEAVTPLLCVDDLDVLGDDALEHVQLLHLIEQLREHCALLLMGQRVILEADETVLLAGLDDEGAATLLAAAGAPDFPDNLRHEIVQATRGQPALLRLFAALVRSGDPPEDALFDLARTPSIEALFNRVWRRLLPDERQLLLQLSVFNAPSPLDAWHEEAIALEHLFERQVIVGDGRGGVEVSGHLRRVVLERMPAEQCPVLHLRAASIREARAEITQAMRHALEGGQPERAVWLWFSNREREAEHGSVAAALELLRRISLTEMAHAEDRTALQVARAELYHRTGRMEEADSELQAVSLSGATTLAGYVRLTRGKVKDMQGQVEQALQNYRAAIDLFVGLPQQHEIMSHLRLSFLHLYRQHELGEARRQAMLARAKADAFLGDMETMAGNYAAALDHLQQAAAALNEHGDDLVTRSRVYSYLGRLYGQTGQYEKSLQAIEQAMECDARLGDKVGPLYDRINQATFLKDAGRADEAEAVARQAIAEAQHMRNGYLVSGLAASAADACLAQEHWEDAEYFALLSLGEEEEFFRASACAVLGCVRETQGRRAEGERLFDEAQESAQQIGDRYMVAHVWRLRGESALRAKRASVAQGAFDRAGALYRELGLTHQAEPIERARMRIRELASSKPDA